jgi:hypothetical protein
MIPNPDSPKMYTPEQVADILQLSKDSVYNFIRSGLLPRNSGMFTEYQQLRSLLCLLGWIMTSIKQNRKI